MEDEKDDDGNVTSYKASGRYIGMQEGYEYLRAYMTSNLTNDNYYKATLYSEYPGILEAPTVEEPEITPTPAPEVGRYFLGFEVGESIYYINGSMQSGSDYKGALVSNIGLATPVTLAAAEGDDAYYLTFEIDETTYYVCIIDTGSHVNLQYLTTATPIYWDETHAAWVNQEDTYFLCYNSTYSCAYASDFNSWWGKSPVGSLFEIPQDWEPTTPSTDVLSITELREAISNGDVNATSGAVSFYGKIVARRDESNIKNGVYLQDGEDAVMLYNGNLESLWTSESLSLGDDVLVSATYSSYQELTEMQPSTIEKINGEEYNIAEPVTWTPTSSEWLNATESCSGRLTTLDLIYNGGSISTTDNTTLTMNFSDDKSKEATVYFYSNMGSTYLEEVKAVFDDLVVGDHIKLTGIVAWYNGIQLAPHYIYKIENNASCLEVLNTAAPTSITIEGNDEVIVGRSMTLTVSFSGENYDKHVVWTSSSEAASVDENGKVTGNYVEPSITITATSRVDSSVYGTKTISVVAAPEGQEEVELCSYDFSKTTSNADNVDASALKTIFDDSFVASQATSSIITSIDGTPDKVSAHAGGSTGNNNSNLQLSNDCLKLGNKDNGGSFNATTSNEITKITFQAAGWNSTQTLTINSVTTSVTQSAASVSEVSGLTTYTCEIEDATSLAVSSNGRVLIFNMTFYGYL
ncbi:MAG: Ig-like domain-containing protein [Coprobacillus sp.]|nr:Ig-like domain-containing protein [Coprobacillus sp.]